MSSTTTSHCSNERANDSQTPSWFPTPRIKGLSGARNTGVGMASGEIVLFLDDDAVAETEWVRYMAEPFDRKEVVGVGGLALPSWDAGKRPLWFPEEFLWVVGCSYVGLPRDGAPIRNPIGSSMGFRRSSVIASGGFSSGLGRIGSKPLGGEETELSMRIRRHSECDQVILCRQAIVNHRVPVERQRISYFVKRCYWEGISKSAIVRRQAAGEKSWAKVFPRNSPMFYPYCQLAWPGGSVKRCTSFRWASWDRLLR